MPCTGGQQRIFEVCLDIPGRDSRQIVVCAGAFCCLVVTKVCLQKLSFVRGVFWQFLWDALYLCILQGSFDIPLNDSGKIMVCAGIFWQCSLDALCRGATRHFCRGL